MAHSPLSPGSIGIQSVLYETDLDAAARSLDSLDQAAHVGRRTGAVGDVAARLGDCSTRPLVDAALLTEWRRRFTGLTSIDVEFFGANLGHAGAQNRLAAHAEETYLVLVNPDVVVSPRALGDLAAVFQPGGIGMADGRQLPIEHPKRYDPVSGSASWCSGAFAMISTPIFHQVNGFDAESFFMHCDDVDISWRVRELGLDVVTQPAATVFHDKRLSAGAGWMASHAERFHAAEGALLLAYKWSRPDVESAYETGFLRDGGPEERNAVDSFRQRHQDGRLPARRDPENRVAEFTGGTFGAHRFEL